MRFHIITLFPNSFDSYLSESILKRAIEDGKIRVHFYNPRDYTTDKNKRIDRAPYGGGPGMVIQAEPVIKALAAALKKVRSKRAAKIIWLEPSGKQFDTAYAKSVAKKLTDLIFICGRYEGIDARVKKAFKVEDVSVGPFVLTGGELPAMIMIDCIGRQVPGVLGDIASLEETRVASPDVYTRPPEIKYKRKILKVPKVLLSGHHKNIEEWRAKRSGR
ncbi:MAG: tRNA (guanosine(37)-N1)-methyltransferase TrmD [Candidatus Taylorbacteria bacterium]|nr:tRNA (guanosine(37)-N1)-methyltransferase TrmD [Candidatus Taylorbacteria bacterium]